jgi:hypothetical protein
VPATAELLVDGSFDFTAGVDSGRNPLVASAQNPNGLSRSQVAWLNNGTCRGGSIGIRNTFQSRVKVSPGNKIYQGSKLYVPLSGNPYYLALIGGHVLQILCDAPYTVTDLSVKFGNLFHPANTKAYFCQGAQFMVIQAGDWMPNNAGTLPLFWDGATLRRSGGIISANNVPGGAPLGLTPFNELPSALAMVFYQGRIWYAQGQQFTAGDIIGGAAGTLPYNFTDSVLKVTENPLAIGGDGFSVSQDAGPIVAMSYTMTTDSTLLGEGPLYVFTTTKIFAQTVPVTRADWIGATGSNQPVQIPVQLKFGAVSDRSVTHVNGDLFYATLEPGVRSLFVASRFFGQWANTPISRNERRVLNYTDRNGMFSSPGINFDNRLLIGVQPVSTPVGVAYQSLMALDFDILSTFGAEGVNPTSGANSARLPPAWEGMWQGLDILDMDTQPWAGIDRAFAFVYSQVDGSINVWEFTPKTPNVPPLDGTNRVVMSVETAAYDWNGLFILKSLEGGELFLDEMMGTVDLEIEYRVDADPCWRKWYQKQFVISANTAQTVREPIPYPPTAEACKGQKFPVVLPKPPLPNCVTLNHRPSNIGYFFQMRITLKGIARLRGFLFYASRRYQPPYEGLKG